LYYVGIFPEILIFLSLYYQKKSNKDKVSDGKKPEPPLGARLGQVKKGKKRSLQTGAANLYPIPL